MNTRKDLEKLKSGTQVSVDVAKLKGRGANIIASDLVYYIGMYPESAKNKPNPVKLYVTNTTGGFVGEIVCRPEDIHPIKPVLAEVVNFLHKDGAILTVSKSGEEYCNYLQDADYQRVNLHNNKAYAAD